MGIEHGWNDTDKGRPQYLELNLPWCHFVHLQSYMDWLEFEPGPL
jgi:hypothetical protein